MPHIIIESTIENPQLDVSVSLLDVIYKAVNDTGLFDVDNIKARIVPISSYKLSTGMTGFIHIQCRIHAGRSGNEKKLLTTGIMNALRKYTLDVSVVTIETVDIESLSYIKYKY